MVNILLVYDNMEPPVEITYSFLLEFGKIYNCEIVSKRSDQLNASDLNSSDVVIEIRPQSMFLAKISKLVSKSGRLSIAMYDDDFLAIKDFHIRRRVQEKAILSTLKNIDVLFSTNNGLIEKYGNLGNVRRCLRTDTAVTLKEIKSVSPIKKESDESKSIKAIYYCNDGSTETFDRVIGTIIPGIVDEIGDRIHWTFIGTKPKIDNSVRPGNVRFIDHLSLDGFKNELKNGDYSFGLAPLLDNEFSNHKYINKFIEFTIAGIPCIYSNVSPYKECIIDGKEGILCINEEKSWIDAIKKMLDPDFRISIIQNAQKKLADEYSLESIAARIADAVPEMNGKQDKKNNYSSIKSSSLKRVKFSAKLYRIEDVIFRVLGRLRIEGLYSLIQYSLNRRGRR